jgi:hypothetical protein
MLSQFKTGLLAAAAAATLTSAQAAVSVANGVLTINLGPGNYDVAIETGMALRQVKLTNVPGQSVTGLYNNINRIRYISGAGDDKIDLKQIGTVLPAVEIVSSNGSIFLNAEIDVPATTAPVTSTLSVQSGPGSSNIKTNIESDASTLVLDWNTVLGAGVHEMLQEVVSDDPTAALRGNIFVDFGTGQSKNTTLIKTGARAVDLLVNMDAGSNGTLSFVTEHLAQGGAARANVTLSGAQETEWKWVAPQSSLSLAGLVRGSALNEKFTVGIDAATTGSFNLNGGQGGDVVSAEFLRAVNVTGRIRGDGANDELFVVGQTGLGALIVDGGADFDKCSGPAVKVACEAN